MLDMIGAIFYSPDALPITQSAMSKHICWILWQCLCVVYWLHWYYCYYTTTTSV